MSRWSLVGSATFAWFLAGSASAQTDTPHAGGNVLLLMKTADNPFFQRMEEGARDAIAAASTRRVQLHVRTGEREDDVTSQRKALEWFLDTYARRADAGKSAGVLITPAASQRELTEPLRAIRDRGVPVVILDTRIDAKALGAAGLKYSAYFGSDNSSGGRMAAEEILSAVPTATRVLLLNGVEGQETARARRNGFKTAMKAKAPTVQIVERTCNWRRSEARTTFEALLTSGQAFDAVFAENDEMALGVVEAFDQAPSRRRRPIVVGFDAIPEAVKAVNEGRLDVTIAQSPYDMGRLGVEYLLDDKARASSMTDRDVPLRVIKRASRSAPILK